jgi:aminoglycoside phosphotransferase family enzyme
METADLIMALTCAEAYPGLPHADVTVVQTHISVLFFAGDRVYKVKKPIKLDFLDYSTLEQRRHFCEEEVRLNRRLAPGVYLGVVAIVRDPEGMIRVKGAGETIDHAVEMVRLPADRMMSAALDRGEIDNHQLDEIAQLLARFHRAVATGPGVDEFGQPAEIAKQVEENYRELQAFVTNGAAVPQGVTGTISCTLLDHLHASARTWLTSHEDLLDRRAHDGHIREGHGDLHTGNICLTRDAILIYDCIEFSRRFRCRDVACELAFLAMDLDLRCFRGFARYLLHRYAALTADPELPSVADFYKIHLALVRGKVASIRAADPNLDTDGRERARLEAMRYFHLAGAYTLHPTLILVCGLPATGKSHAARAIARPFEAAVLRSDVLRKKLAGLAPRACGGGELDTGIYAPEFTRRTYSALLDRAREHLRHNKTVIVDATFPTAAMRRPFFDAARESGIECVLVEMTCPEEVIRQRMRRRATDPVEVSDADWRVYQHVKARFEAPDEQCLRLDSQVPPEDMVATVIDRLIRC